MTAEFLNQSAIDDLATALEEGARANQRNVDKFIEPAVGTLRRAKSKRHHLIFGRRGSGKSSLLNKSVSELALLGHPVAMVDLEPFKVHQYPDVLISVLIASLKGFKKWLSDNLADESKEARWYNRFFKRLPSSLNEKRKLLVRIENHIEELSTELHQTDNTMVTSRVSATENGSDSVSVDLKTDFKAPVGRAAAQTGYVRDDGFSSLKEDSEQSRRSKKESLYRKILDFQETFTELYSLSGRAAYLVLDDLYHLRKEDQPYVLDYFHRIAKNNELWLKVGTIKNRSSWYVDSPQPIGMKIGDDADDIPLDLTLEKFSSSKEFLVRILDSYAAEQKAPSVSEMVTSGGIDRLVIASGGVTRDFIGLFRRSIDEARERLNSDPKHTRGPKIGAEDVNIAAGSYGETKWEEFQKDSFDDRQRLENAFEKLRYFCLNVNKANVFLIEQDEMDDAYEAVQELIDLRLVHHIKSRVTVRGKSGKLYRALMIDLSQYTGERARRDVEMIQFWKSGDKDVLRKNQLVFDPHMSLDDLQAQNKKMDKKPLATNAFDTLGDQSSQNRQRELAIDLSTDKPKN